MRQCFHKCNISQIVKYATNMSRQCRMDCNALSVIVLLLVSFGSVCNGYMVGNNPHYRSETLDSGGRYQLEWSVDFDQKRITFNVTVQTNGYVAFGLSQNGSLNAKSDIVIGGVNPNGKTYFTDRYSMGNQMSEVDEKQDWTLHDARESASHTFLSFSRAFDTCDANDFPITVNANPKVYLKPLCARVFKSNICLEIV